MRNPLYTNKIQISNDFFGALKEVGLVTLDDFLTTEIGELLATEKHKNVRRFQVTIQGEAVTLYLKQVKPKDGKRIKLLYGKKVELLSTREVKMLDILHEKNLPAMRYVAWGERTILNRIPVQGFILVEEVKGKELVDEYCNGSKEERIRIMFALGQLLYRLADIGFYYPPRLRDFICNTDINGNYSLVMIDREVGPQLETPTHEGALRFIARTYGKMRLLNQLVSPMEGRAFVNGFCEQGSSAGLSKKLLYRQCINSILTLGKHHKKYSAVLSNYPKL